MQPSRILDLHTHMFNARYLPLASIIADAMGRDSSLFANAVARLLYSLTDSSYEPKAFERLAVIATTAGAKARALHGDQDHGDHDHGAVDEEAYIDAIWSITEHELVATTQSFEGIRNGSLSMAVAAPGSEAAKRMASSELMGIIRELDAFVPADEGLDADDERADDIGAEGFAKAMAKGGGDAVGWAERVVKRALRRLQKWMDPEAWGRYTNYVEFFFTLLASERNILARLREGYGQGLPSIRFVHFMMDMQMAYPSRKAAYYPVHPAQMQRMQQLHRDAQGGLLGFWAFDPRRADWRAWAEEALAKGFLGFKFYPAMGYRPDGDAQHAATIEAFYAFCVERDVPIFAHCTPEGFQTRRKEGHFANPAYWEAVLARHPTLRLCLGHAGGGRAGKGEHFSHGWGATNEDEWKLPGNYARRVVKLCKQYPNVYCEVGHLVDLLGANGRQRFLDNLVRANAEEGEYDFMHKLAYGTDWHMQAMVNAARRFLDGFIELFARPELAPHAERFFWQNGYAYLKLPA